MPSQPTSRVQVGAKEAGGRGVGLAGWLSSSPFAGHLLCAGCGGEGVGDKRRREPERQTHLGLPPAQLRTEFTESAVCLPTLGTGGRTKVG